MVQKTKRQIERDEQLYQLTTLVAGEFSLQEVLERLGEKLAPENIYRTDEQGTIEFITDGERLWARVEDKNHYTGWREQ